MAIHRWGVGRVGPAGIRRRIERRIGGGRGLRWGRGWRRSGGDGGRGGGGGCGEKVLDLLEDVREEVLSEDIMEDGGLRGGFGREWWGVRGGGAWERGRGGREAVRRFEDDVKEAIISHSNGAKVREEALFKRHPIDCGGVVEELDKNLQLLRQRLYYVTWKADGTRYMMLICPDGCYLIDRCACVIGRNFRFRRVQMRFPARKHLQHKPVDDWDVHRTTLLDGEMVVDELPGTDVQERRYLIYDLMMLDSVPLGDRPFAERFELIEREVVAPRKMDAAMNPLYDYSLEDFKVRRKGFYMVRRKDFYMLSTVRRKDFYMLSTVGKLLHDFIPKLSHESDGLILQHLLFIFPTPLPPSYPVRAAVQKSPEGKWVLLLSDRKTLRALPAAKFTHPGRKTLRARSAAKFTRPGRCLVLSLALLLSSFPPALLLWPHTSVKDHSDYAITMSLCPIHTSAARHDEEEAKELEGKIVECCWKKDEAEWEFMRVRTDKEHPNAWHTYLKVMESIRDNITEEVLLKEVQHIRSLPVQLLHPSPSIPLLLHPLPSLFSSSVSALHSSHSLFPHQEAYVITKLDSAERTFKELSIRLADPEVASNATEYMRIAKSAGEIEEVASAYAEWKDKQQQLADAKGDYCNAWQCLHPLHPVAPFACIAPTPCTNSSHSSPFLPAPCISPNEGQRIGPSYGGDGGGGGGRAGDLNSLPTPHSFPLLPIASHFSLPLLAPALMKDSASDPEMAEMAGEEVGELEAQLEELEGRLKVLLLPTDPLDARNIMLEVRAGTGGDEAGIWAGDLVKMYGRYADKNGWRVSPVSCTE
ncbi:unnamed protein product, partial [Closterium sp. NIES-65]